MPPARGGVHDPHVTLDLRKLDRIIARMPTRSERVAADTARVIVQSAHDRTPPRVDSGRLMRGWRAIRYGRLFWRIGNLMPYAKFHEWGTTRIAAHPMLRPAVEDGRRFLRRAVAGLFRP